MDERLKTCAQCGTDTEANVAFVPFEEQANDAQQLTDWYAAIPDQVYAVVCGSCGYLLAVFDPQDLNDTDPDDLPDTPRGRTDTSDFKIEEELE